MSDDPTTHLAVRAGGHTFPASPFNDSAVGINGSVMLHKPSWSSAEKPSGCFDGVPPNVSVLPLDDRGEEYLARPPGHMYRNQNGMEFKVFRYAPFGFRHAPVRADGDMALDLYHGHRPPTCVLPIVSHMNPSRRLKGLYDEIAAVTPKQLIVADASGLSEKSRQIMEGFQFTSWREYPDLMTVIIDSSICREDVMAHELMHIWLDLFEEYEDHRRFRDINDGRSSFAVLSVQSMVIDCKVHQKLRERGFSLRQWTSDSVEGLYKNAIAMESGATLRNRSQESVVASLLAMATAVPELYDLTGEHWGKMSSAREVFKRRLPRLVRLADGFTGVFRRQDWATKGGALKLIDECLRLHFAYLGLDLDIDRDLRVEQDQIKYRDKFPHILLNVPAEFKYDILRRLIRDRWPRGTQVITRWTEDGCRLDVDFVPPSQDIARVKRPCDD